MIKKILLRLLEVILVAVIGVGYFTVGYALVSAENRVVEREYSQGPPFVQVPQGFFEKVVTAGGTVPVIGKSDYMVRHVVIVLWPVYYIGGTVLLWVGVQLINAISLGGYIAIWLGLV